MPTEWTYNKEIYICLQIEGEHYTPMRLSYKNKELDMCLSRGDIRCLMKACSIDYDYLGLY